MIPIYYKQLIDSLTESTSNNKSHWNRTSTPDQYKLLLDSGMIVISCANQLYKSSIRIDIYDEIGKLIDSIIEDNTSSHDYTTLSTLFYMIKNQKDAITSRKINEFVKELKSGKDIGKEE
ncbi:MULTISPECIES: hypothetical protein [Butyricimonas]|uniref:hypothetical protein n=1 Tax=Butyricimonas TaxID=574697 RepID=UPI0007FB3F0D|nr:MULTISPECIES: hypothetical protein [Butyricimonas]